ncbi:MAG: hypothetical protein AB8I08_01090 [Sandaracinaceae bacterium]
MTGASDVSTQRRRCAVCDRPDVRCVESNDHRGRSGMPLGSTHQHRCGRCGHEFQTCSMGFIIAMGLTGLMMGFFGTGLFVRTIERGRFGLFELVVGLGSLLAAAAGGYWW